MSVLTRDGRVCPICGRTNYVKMEVVSVPKGFVFHVTATCADCGYEFLFGAAGMIYGIGLVGALVIFFIAIWKQINIGGACVVGLMVLALCLIIIALMANAALFEGYIDRQILKKAEIKYKTAFSMRSVYRAALAQYVADRPTFQKFMEPLVEERVERMFAAMERRAMKAEERLKKWTTSKKRPTRNAANASIQKSRRCASKQAG